ncbi:MAG: putative histidine kinase, CheA, partial [Rhodoferax sp.]|nr:putative histidine kinase, CheA [Rhodoferax sp.]
RAGQPPRIEVAMEVATAVLYLEAAFQDLDPTDSQLAVRTARLAERLDQVRQGGQAQALESWMEELYRRVSDRQTMGSVVGELRGTLGELEKVLDAFFRNPQEKAALQNAPGHLLQMRGVLSVLGLDQAAHAVVHMRDAVEGILHAATEEEQAKAAGTYEKLGNNLGALGFLIDMLNYQPTLAKKLFVYDDGKGELRPLMGRVAAPAPRIEPGLPPVAEPAATLPAAPFDLNPEAVQDTAAAQLVAAPGAGIPEPTVAMAPVPQAAPSVTVSPPAVVVGEPDAELLEIFLEEAREVVGNGLAALETLAGTPSDVAELTTLRRAFHTLKGSSRMVGLNEFGEAGWALEQVLNTWLADQKPATEPLRTLAAGALRGFGRWADDIAAHDAAQWKASMFRVPADALRTEDRLLPLDLPGEPATAVAEPTPVAPQLSVPDIATDFPEVPMLPAVSEPLVLPDFDALLSPPEADSRSGSLDSPATQLDFMPIDPVESTEVSEVPLADLDLSMFSAAPAPAPSAAAGMNFGATQVIRDEPALPVELQATDLPDDFDFLSAPQAAPELPAVPPEISAIDFGSLDAIAQPAPAQVAIDEAAAAAAAAADDQIKVIGGLRIGIPLYNVYLNEADEWSRRLATEIGEWALELARPVPDSVVGLAHALGGSSATVGFHALSEVARTLESSLQHAQTLAFGTAQHGRAFIRAAEEIRRLLHQFAAGFLKNADPTVVQELHAVDNLAVPQRGDLRDSGPGDLPTAFSVPMDEPAPSFGGHATQFVDFDSLSVPSAPAVTATEIHAIEGEEDIDVADALDPDLFSIFEEEAAELLPLLGGALRLWAAQGDAQARDGVLRALHTLKGSARLAGALRLGELAHRME